MPIPAADGARRIITVCAGVQPGERVAVLVDDDERGDVARALVDAAAAAGAEATLRRLDPAVPVPQDLLAQDVLIGATSASIYHTELGRVAAADGARVLAVTGCDEATLREGAIEADFVALEPLALDLAERLGRASEIEVSSPRGLRLRAALTQRDGYACTGRATTPGSRTGCPDIEAYIAPLEQSVEGTVVVDGSSTQFGLVDGPIQIDVVGGRAQDVRGGKHAALLRGLFEQHGDAARCFAEFGFGLNPCARVIGKIIEDEATYGTGHVAFGTNESFGGANQASVHIDLVYWHPTVRLDGAVVMRDGVLEV